MSLVFKCIVTESLQVIKHNPLDSIAAYAVSNEFEYIFGLLHKLRVCEVQICTTTLLNRACLDYAPLQLSYLQLRLLCPRFSQSVFEASYEGDPLACQSGLSHLKTHKQAVLTVCGDHVVKYVEAEGRLPYLLRRNDIEHVTVFHSDQLVEFRPLKYVLRGQINFAVQFIFKLRQGIH